MSQPVGSLIATTVSRIESALVDWLPGQRWFSGKNRTIARVRLTVAARFAGGRTPGRTPEGLLAVADVRFAGSTATERYHLPLGVHRDAPEGADSIITRINGQAVYDATGDQELMAELLRLICRSQVIGPVRFTAEASGELAFAHRNDLRSRRNTGEQSNTSVMFGDRFILKLFRRLPDGRNPDLDVHRALGRAASEQVAPLLGAIEGELAGEQLTFGVLHSFVSDSTEGWELATAELYDVLCGGDNDSPLAGQAASLGAAVAAVHRDLADQFGATLMSEADVSAQRVVWLEKLDRAMAAVPALARYAEPLTRAFNEVGADAVGAWRQRVHGDLHLGQVLRTTTRWLLLDFEGEPALPLPDRVLPHSPLRDVAGMLRSFDYVTHHLLRTGDSSRFGADACGKATRWADRARAEFCAGYAETAGQDPRARVELLRAYELEKVIYETVYETNNRPSWAHIPLRALRLLLEPATSSA